MDFKEILGWLFIFVVGSLIVSIIVNPSILTSVKNNFNSAFKQPVKEETITDPLIQECLTSFNECKDVATTKYNSLSIKIIQIEKFNDENSAKIFYEKWSSPMQRIFVPFFGIESELDYPIVLIATNTRAEEETPIVAICNSNGDLTNFTEQSFLC